MIFTATKYLFLAFLLWGAGKLSTMELREAQQAEMEYPKDKDGDGQHDADCQCGYCLDEPVNETDKLIMDETWLISPENDEKGRTLIFTYNEEISHILKDSSNVQFLDWDMEGKDTIWWFKVKK